MAKLSLSNLIVANKNACEALKRRFPVFFRDEGGHRLRLRTRLDEVVADQHPKQLLDVGSANRPMLPLSPDYTLTGLDVEALSGVDDLYDNFILQSIEAPIDKELDLIYSNAVLEHVPDNKAAAGSMYAALRDGGTIVHYLPCKNHPYALLLRLVGKRLQKVIIRKLRPWTDQTITGYPTHFHHCSPGQMRRLLATEGFSDIEVIPFYRANSYFKFFVPVFILVTAFENFCRHFGISYFCSGMIISGRKPT